MAADIETHHFADDGETPNHPTLPLVVIRRTGAAAADDPAAWFEQRYAAHGWGATWRWGVYPFHHFHSTNHEVLGVSRGSARLLLGGGNGVETTVTCGDLLVLPAGTGHCCRDSSADFEVVGAYPRGEKPDLIRSGEGDLAAARRRILAVPPPPGDPLAGADGPLMEHWK